VHRPAPGLTLLLGYNGRGVALATTLGTLVGANLAHPGAHPLPLPLTGLSPIPLHAMHRLYATTILQMYRVSDYLAVR
jgi:glycine/D-amino acid oxidase-like deaminating enzyme